MLKSKSLPEQSDAERDVKQQAEVVGRLKNFKNWLYEKVKGEERFTGTTKVVFFFERHSPRDAELFKDWIEKNKPDVIVLEAFKDRKFKKMLDGGMSIEKYMKRHKYTFPEFSRQQFEFLREYHHREPKVKIEQVDPGPKNLRVEFLKEFAYKALGISMDAHLFDASAHGLAVIQGLDAILGKQNDARRAFAIDDRIRKGKWHGTILVEAGSDHTEVKNLLKGWFKYDENVEISSIFSTKNLVEKEFGAGTLEVYPQAHEIERRSRYKKDLSGEELLAARFIIAACMYETDCKDDAEELKAYQAIKMANRLSYEECKEVYKKTENMTTDERFNFVKEYLKKRDEKITDSMQP